MFPPPAWFLYAIANTYNTGIARIILPTAPPLRRSLGSGAHKTQLWGRRPPRPRRVLQPQANQQPLLQEPTDCVRVMCWCTLHGRRRCDYLYFCDRQWRDIKRVLLLLSTSAFSLLRLEPVEWSSRLWTFIFFVGREGNDTDVLRSRIWGRTAILILNCNLQCNCF